MIIKVTEDHIKNGLRCTTTCCPVALALQEISSNVSVGLVGIWLDSVRYKVPRSVYRFIRRFDNNKTVKPFNFILKEYK